VKLLMAESGTGVACVGDDVEELEAPLLPFCVLEELCAEDASTELGVEADSPVLVEALRVLTVPLDAADVRPEVLCEDEPELELLLP